jgi:hypothetical protein
MRALLLKILRRMVAAMVATVLVVLFGASPAHAESTVALRCGKTFSHGSWPTWPAGGYTGSPCGAQIDYATTPTGGENGLFESYSFSLSSFAYYRVDVWVPCEHANAVMDWETTVVHGQNYYHYDQVTHQADLCGWYTVTPVFWNGPSSSSDLIILVKAWSGMVTPCYWMGTDAVRIVQI